MTLDLSNFQALIPILVPLILSLARAGLGALPKWTLPILAPVLGGLLDALHAWLASGQADPTLGVLLGAAGVGLREVVDQARKAATRA